MAHATWPLLIGLISTFMYTSLALYYFVYLLHKCGLFDRNEPVENSALTNDAQSTANLATSNTSMNIFVVVGDLITFIAMIVASILLQIGIQKERVQLLYIWLGMSDIAICFPVVSLIFANSYTDVDFILNAILIVVQVLMWYPIYVHSKKLRQHNRVHIQNLAMQQQRAAYCHECNSNAVYGPTTELVSSTRIEI